MPTYNDYGIILSTNDLAEADKILNIYTKENGLVRAIAKGARKTSSRFLGKVDMLSCCYFHFAKGKNLDIVIDCSQINSFGLLRSDLTRLTTGILFLEIVDSFAYEMESESGHIYELLFSNLDALQGTKDPGLLSLKFILNFLDVHGYKPQLDTCVACSKQIKEDHDYCAYSSVLGGILCKECTRLISHKLIGIGVLKVIRKCRMWNAECGMQDAECRMNDRDIRLALDLLREHIDIRAKDKIKSFDLMFSL